MLLALTLHISLAPNSDILNIQFFMAPHFALPCDGRLGLDSLVAHDISVHPKRRVIFSGECFHPVMDVKFPFIPTVASISDEKTLYPCEPCSTA